MAASAGILGTVLAERHTAGLRGPNAKS
jgi:hypothetical protein